EHEEMLLEFADEMSLKDFRRAIEYWCQCADSSKAEADADQQRQKSYLHASPTLDGMVKIDGLFDKERGETILTALDAAMTEEARASGASEDPRPASARRVDALHDICRQFLDHYPGKVGGNRPHVSMILDWETLMGRSGKRCVLAWTGTVTRETVRRLLFDAQVSRFIVDPEGVPLEMGRSTRTVTPAQMRALAIRDGGCTWPGCERPPEWCDGHHIVHWVDGGPTDLDNLCLYCRRHHVLVH